LRRIASSTLLCGDRPHSHRRAARHDADAWYDGQPGWFIDPSHVVPAGDEVVDGKQLDGSGIFTGQGAPPDSAYPFAPGALAHAGGFLNTGVLDSDPRTAFPRSKTVSFTTPGRFGFICTVHGPCMRGTIEVVS
jgi:hypothetical protein